MRYETDPTGLHRSYGKWGDKRSFCWITREGITDIIALPGLYSRRGRVLTVWALAVILQGRWVWDSAPRRYFPSWVCMFVRECMCASTHVFWLSSWCYSLSSQSCTDRWKHHQCLLNRVTAKVTCVRNIKEQPCSWFEPEILCWPITAESVWWLCCHCQPCQELDSSAEEPGAVLCGALWTQERCLV